MYWNLETYILAPTRLRSDVKIVRMYGFSGRGSADFFIHWLASCSHKTVQKQIMSVHIFKTYWYTLQRINGPLHGNYYKLLSAVLSFGITQFAYPRPCSMSIIHEYRKFMYENICTQHNQVTKHIWERNQWQTNCQVFIVYIETCDGLLLLYRQCGMRKNIIMHWMHIKLVRIYMP